MSTSLAVVVVESGSAWPAFVSGLGLDLVALNQVPDYASDPALQRACDRAERTGGVVKLAVVACNADVDEAAVRRRTVTAVRLLTALARSDRGLLVLSASVGITPMLRHVLKGLAETLNDALRGSSASVTVCIGGRLARCAGSTAADFEGASRRIHSPVARMGGLSARTLRT
jgi:hypothetical protein